MSVEAKQTEEVKEEKEVVEVQVKEEEEKKEEQQTLNLEESEKSQDEDSLDDYSQKVQRRIKKLTEKYRKEERDKEEAVRLSQTLKDENEKLKGKLDNLDKGYLSEYDTRVNSQLATAKEAYKQAHESGDADKLFDAQQALAKISIEQERLRIAKQRAEQNEKLAESNQQTQQTQQQAQPVEPDPKAKAWAEKNEWFGDDEVMTSGAFAIHKILTEQEGFDTTSDEYYSELDKRLRKEFPNRFEQKVSGGSTRVASADTSASRSGKRGARTVKLTPSQVAMARRLNVPLEEYAKYVKE